MMTLTDSALERFVVEQRWFGSKSREVISIEVIESIRLRAEQPCLDLTIVEVRFQPGTHELYQLPIGRRPASDRWDRGVIAEDSDEVIYDAMTDPVLISTLIELMNAGGQVETQQGVAEFRHVGEPIEAGESRPLGAEQSNSSVIIGDRSVIKAFRRLGPGVNPELEMLDFLTRHSFPNIARLRGWYAHTGGQLDATLGIVQDYVGEATDGWDLALADLRSGDPGRFESRARSLGEVTGQMHAVLGSDASESDFAPHETSMEALGLLTATIDEEIELIFRELPDDVPELEPIRGRGQEMRERLGSLTQVGSAGRVIRHHGDYHLGQVLLTEGDLWVVLDFEGEPARTAMERRGKRSPLRDVAGMLRSFAYAANASRILQDVPAPTGWEAAVRDAFMDGYLETTELSLLPPGRGAIDRLLSVFELEKTVYELRYELDHRPGWVSIPVSGIVELLDRGPDVAAGDASELESKGGSTTVR